MLERHLLLVGVILFSGQLCSADDFDKENGYHYHSAVGGWLRLHTITATAENARLRCQFEGGHLAIPTTSALTSAMRNIMHSLLPMVTSVLIGEPSSNLGLPWARGEPNNDNRNSAEDCLGMTDAGELADVKCTDKHAYICHKEGAELAGIHCGTWDKGYNLDNRTGSCYKFHTTPRSWFAAEATCRAEHAHLAVISSETEAQVLNELFRQHSPDSLTGVDDSNYAHVGYRDFKGNKEWHSIYGQTFNETGFGQWGDDEPNYHGGREHCLTVRSHDGKFNDFFCDAKQPFICEINTK